MEPNRFPRIVKDENPRFPCPWWRRLGVKRTTRIFFTTALLVAVWG